MCTGIQQWEQSGQCAAWQSAPMLSSPNPSVQSESGDNGIPPPTDRPLCKENSVGPFRLPEGTFADRFQKIGQVSRRAARSPKVATSLWFRGRENSGAIGNDDTARANKTTIGSPVMVEGTRRPSNSPPSSVQIACAHPRQMFREANGNDAEAPFLNDQPLGGTKSRSARGRVGRQPLKILRSVRRTMRVDWKTSAKAVVYSCAV